MQSWYVCKRAKKQKYLALTHATPALPCPALPCPTLHCPAPPCPAPSCPALPCPALPCQPLHCPAPPCPASLLALPSFPHKLSSLLALPYPCQVHGQVGSVRDSVLPHAASCAQAGDLSFLVCLHICESDHFPVMQCSRGPYDILFASAPRNPP